MMTPYKILPIHASHHSNGRILSINDKYKRTHSALSRQHETVSPSKNTEEPRIYKPQTAHVISRTQRSLIDSPRRPVVQFPAFLTEGVTQKYRTTKSPGASSKKKNYLSRKVLQKQLLQSYLDSIFKRVSLIRTNETKGLSQTKRAKTRPNWSVR